MRDVFCIANGDGDDDWGCCQICFVFLLAALWNAVDVIGGQDERSTRMMGLDVIRDFAFDSIAPEGWRGALSRWSACYK